MTDIVTELSKRRILPAVGVYAASCWVLIEILDRLVERYLLSPYLTDIVFWGLYSLIPAVILVAWSYGKPGKDKATTAQKVGVPINIIATLGLLITVFGDKDLDLAATQVTVENELGQQETHYIPSESFRSRMAIFFWGNESGQPELDWLQYGITELLTQDLQQDPFVLAHSPWSNNSNGFYSRIRQAGFDDGLNVPRSLMREIADEANRQYFVDGSFDKVADNYVVTARVWNTQTLEQVAELTRQNWDLYAAVDQLSKDVREALEVPKSSTRIAEDLPLGETYGESEEALKAYIQGLNTRLFDNDFATSNMHFERATSIDPNFVLGWFLKAANLIESGNLPAAQTALAKAQEMDYRLPSRDRVQLKAIVYRLAGEHEKLMSFLRLQVQIRDDATSHNRLATMYMISGELNKAKQEFLAALERDSLNVGTYLNLSVLERATGDIEAAVDYARSYQKQKPEDIEANIQLGDLLRDGGDLEAAEAHYKQAQILENAPVLPTLRLSLVALRKGEVNTARNYLSEAEGFAQTPAEKIQVRQAAAYQEARLGRIQEAIRQTREMETFMRQSQTPFAVAIGVYAPLIMYHVLVDDLEAARDTHATAMAMLQPPMDQFLAFSEALIQAREKDIVAAEASLERAVGVLERFQLKMIEFQVPIVRAKISKAQGDSTAVAGYSLQALEMIQRSVLGGELQIAVPQLYAETATAQINSGQLDAAEQSLSAGFLLDPSEPTLWFAKARLQQAQKMPQMALASVNYALAIWADADERYIAAGEARSLAAELVQ